MLVVAEVDEEEELDAFANTFAKRVLVCDHTIGAKQIKEKLIDYNRFFFKNNKNHLQLYVMMFVELLPTFDLANDDQLKTTTIIERNTKSKIKFTMFIFRIK